MQTSRYFHIKMLVAVEADRPIFVYIDPGMGTCSELDSWGTAHRRLEYGGYYLSKISGAVQPYSKDSRSSPDPWARKPAHSSSINERRRWCRI